MIDGTNDVLVDDGNMPFQKNMSLNGDESETNEEENEKLKQMFKEFYSQQAKLVKKTFEEVSYVIANSDVQTDDLAANGPDEEEIEEQSALAINFQPSGLSLPMIDLGAPPGYDKAIAEKRRSKLITMKHTLKEKMVLYHFSTKGQLDELKNLFQKAKDGGAPEGPYSLTEEVSKSGFYWTVLHYASHYGHYDVLAYLIDLLEDHPHRYDIFNL